MKAIFFTLFLAVSSAFAQYESKTGAFNITSPKSDGIYVAGQRLPVIYDQPTDNTTVLSSLAISFSSATNPNFTAINIVGTAGAVDVSRTPTSFVPTQNGSGYYEHQIDFIIPASVPAGQYQINFVAQTSDSGTENFSIPISVNAYVASSTAITTTTTTLNTNSSQTTSIVHATLNGAKNVNVGMGLLFGAAGIVAALLL